MKYGYRTTITAGIVGFILVLAVISCQSEKAIDPQKERVINETEELFTRSKVLDYEVLYENEYPYLREELDLDTYLKNRYIQWGRVDTLMAIQVDSVTIYGDSAHAHMQLEYVLSDSSLNLTSVNLFWYKIDDTDWVHPTLSHLRKQLEFEEEIRMYWEAVRAMQEKEEAEQAGDSAAADDQ